MVTLETTLAKVRRSVLFALVNEFRSERSAARNTRTRNTPDLFGNVTRVIPGRATLEYAQAYRTRRPEAGAELVADVADSM